MERGKVIHVTGVQPPPPSSGSFDFKLGSAVGPKLVGTGGCSGN